MQENIYESKYYIALFSDKKDVLLQWLMVLKTFVNNRIKKTEVMGKSLETERKLRGKAGSNHLG